MNNETHGQFVPDEDDRKELIAKSVSKLDFVPINTSIELNREDAIKVPLGQLGALGAALPSVTKTFEGLSQVAIAQPGEQLFRAILPEGASLRQAKDGLFSSSAKFADGSSAWAKFETVGSMTQPTTVPLDPAAIAMACALIQINQKLDRIQATVDKLLDYQRIKDKAQLRSNLEELTRILHDYKFNWSNDQFKQVGYAHVQEIGNDARARILELKAQLEQQVPKKGLFELRRQAHDGAESAADLIKEYQLAVYTYSFSTFLGVMLLENYDPAFLQSKAQDIRDKALEYRTTYSICYDAIESRDKQSIDSYVLGGLSEGIKGLGSAIKKTRLGDATSIDEVLLDVGSDIKGLNEGLSKEAAKVLIQAKDPVTRPFVETLEAVNRVYNQPSQILSDGESIYILPKTPGEKS